MEYLFWTVGLIAIVCTWLFVNKRLYNDVVSPFNLLLPAWIIPLWVKMLHLSKLERPWNVNVCLMVGGTTVILVGISLIISIWIKRAGTKAKVDVRFSFNRVLTNSRVQIIVVMWYLLGIVYYVYDSFITNPIGIPFLTFIQDPDVSRDSYWQWGQGGPATILLAPILGATGILYLMSRISQQIWKKAIFLSLVTIYPLMCLVKMSRMEMIYPVTILAMAEYYYRQYITGVPGKYRSRFRKYVLRLSLVGSVILFSLLSANIFNTIRNGTINGVGSFSKFGDLLEFDTAIPEPFASPLMEYYDYFAMPFENFANFVNEYPGDGNMGVGLTRPVFSVLGLGWIGRDNIEKIGFEKYNFKLCITFPFIEMAYAEGGWIDVMVSALVYAILVNYIYIRFRNRVNLPNLICYLMCPFGWLWMGTWSNFTGILFYAYLLFPYFIYWQYRFFCRNPAIKNRLQKPQLANVPAVRSKPANP